MQKKIQRYFTSFKISERRDREKSIQIVRINRMLENIRCDIVRKEEGDK